VKVTGSSNRRVSLAALIAIKPGCRPRLIYRGAQEPPARQRPAQRLHRDRAMPGLWTPPTSNSAVPWWSCGTNLATQVSGVMADLIAARDWLTVYRLPPYAHELNPVEPAWSHLKR
jgi:hypothetical protein